eukprot:GHVS01098083.1.p1 GENE.GHVS01098083.1~~GHVS01098083.1.p1  ORF type:complete len:528 (+),score=47.41 GHVS01098083.1:58-1584(+)
MAKFRQRKLLAAIPSFLFMVLVFSLQPNDITAAPTGEKEECYQFADSIKTNDEFCNFVWELVERCEEQKEDVIKLQLKNFIITKFHKTFKVRSFKITRKEATETVAFKLSGGQPAGFGVVELTRPWLPTTNEDDMMGHESESTSNMSPLSLQPPADTRISTVNGQSHQMDSSSPYLQSSQELFNARIAELRCDLAASPEATAMIRDIVSIHRNVYLNYNSAEHVIHQNTNAALRGLFVKMGYRDIDVRYSGVYCRDCFQLELVDLENMCYRGTVSFERVDLENTKLDVETLLTAYGEQLTKSRIYKDSFMVAKWLSEESNGVIPSDTIVVNIINRPPLLAADDTSRFSLEICSCSEAHMNRETTRQETYWDERRCTTAVVKRLLKNDGNGGELMTELKLSRDEMYQVEEALVEEDRHELDAFRTKLIQEVQTDVKKKCSSGKKIVIHPDYLGNLSTVFRLEDMIYDVTTSISPVWCESATVPMTLRVKSTFSTNGDNFFYVVHNLLMP